MHGKENVKYATYVMHLNFPSFWNTTRRFEVIGSQNFNPWNMKPVRRFEMP